MSAVSTFRNIKPKLSGQQGNREFPLLDKLYNINTHNMAEWCFSCIFFTF